MSNLDILAPFGCLGRGFLHCSKDGLPCKVGAQVGVSGVGPGAGGVGICQDRLQGRGQRGRGGAFQVGSVGPINFVYVVIIFLLLAKQFFMSIRLSQLDSKVRILTEQVALNEEKVEREKLDL